MFFNMYCALWIITQHLQQNTSVFDFLSEVSVPLSLSVPLQQQNSRSQQYADSSPGFDLQSFIWLTLSCSGARHWEAQPLWRWSPLTWQWVTGGVSSGIQGSQISASGWNQKNKKAPLYRIYVKATCWVKYEAVLSDDVPSPCLSGRRCVRGWCRWWVGLHSGPLCCPPKVKRQPCAHKQLQRGCH